MKLRTPSDIQMFLETVDSCEGCVYLVGPNGDSLNLKSMLSRYIGLGRLLDKGGDLLELFADRREDEQKLVGMMFRLNSGRNAA